MLIRRLLRFESAKRYTVEQALSHPWVARQAPRGRKARAPEGILATRPSHVQLVRLDEALRALEGSIVPWELSDALSRVGIAENPVASSQLAIAADSGNGLVDCSAVSRLRAERAAMRTLLSMESASCDEHYLKDFSGRFQHANEAI